MDDLNSQAPAGTDASTPAEFVPSQLIDYGSIGARTEASFNPGSGDGGGYS